ncbi:MBL fold metallo-hydrolase [Chondromyces apiculatus]|uniref:MBL fold metallo-hydrolase n=1 Tax=Chondromyces apiculatus TaxID=51 RepID=UPI0005C640B8|nr:MBL fold metallo-hydrolase [Chondromyces apiculatus]
MNRPRPVARGVDLFPARTPTLPPATHTNSYALGEREVLLVEPATPHEDEQREWLAWARGMASAGRKLVAIALTHHHVDHVGGAAFFAEALGLPVWAHAETAARLPEIPVTRYLVDGEALTLAGPEPQRLQVLHTPGHAPGHVCLFDEDGGALVAGDMVASVGTILIAPGEGDMKEYLAQLERLAGLGARVALPAHGDPIEAPEALFKHYVAHRLLREARVVAALAGRGGVAAGLDALVAEVYADTPREVWPLARLSLEAHLLKLEQDGKARRDAEGQWMLAGPRLVT